MPNDDNFSLTRILNSLFNKVKPKILQDQHRPGKLPPTAFDCGWNHGKSKESSAMKKSIMEGNANEIINPLPNTIPDIVWDDLLYSEKIKILDAVKLRYDITYFHTERRHQNNIETLNEAYKNKLVRNRCSIDTDVIKIEEYDSENVQKTSGYAISCIYSRVTSERGITKLDNPVMETIPCNIWNNLPDVLKEEIVEGKNYCKKHEGDYNFNVSYSPNENKISIGHGHFMGRYSIDNYDAKRGVYIDGILINGL
jgi:hypothetical protein